MMRRRTGQSLNATGFTLLEVLLALGMVCMVVAMLYSALSAAFKVRDHALAAIAPARAAQVAMDLIRQDLENALPPNATYQNNNTNPNTNVLVGPFIGQQAGTNGSNSDTLEFYCLGQPSPAALSPQSLLASSDPTQAGSIQRIDLGIAVPTDGSGTQPALVRQVTRNLLAQEVIEAPMEMVCRYAKSLTFQYFDGQNWQTSWNSTAVGNVLPQAVQVTLEIQLPPSNGTTPAPYRVTRIFAIPCAQGTVASGGSLP